MAFGSGDAADTETGGHASEVADVLLSLIVILLAAKLGGDLNSPLFWAN